MTGQPFLKLEGIVKTWGEARALDGISLAFARGEMVAVIGRSGAGKSTLLNVINRLIDPDGGTMTCAGRDVLALRGRDLRDWRRGTAMVFQRFNLVARLTVLTNVMTGRLATRPLIPSLLGLFTDEDRARAIEALVALDMGEQALKRADALSGGQQQRVAIARALVQEPQIILADEPVASLDPRNSEAVMDALARINRENGITVLCNLHSVALAQKYCTRAVALARGRVVFDGPTSALTGPVLEQVYGTADLTAIEEAA
ncbi:MAG: phosphonate ABC transporter ATP-binding protein [Gemmobacter sp.]|uniref:phosphonate ABC transporter ATP-binding protein n=1 Tax=Gemmobacter sp. TaxID=1898957 RepID=UPI0039198C2E